MLIGEVVGRFLNDWIMNVSIRRNGGVFEAESRLWYVPLEYAIFSYSSVCDRTCYLAVPLYICGFVVLGASLQMRLSPGALVMGWGIAEVAVMINTVAVCAYHPSRYPAMNTETKIARCLL